MLLGVLVAVVSSSSAQESPIRFEAKGMSVSAALERLSAATGTTLKANGFVGQEIVFISVNDVKPSEIKDRLAKALDASWSHKPEADYLGRTPAQDAEIWKKHVDLRSKMVEDALETLRKQVAKPFSGAELARELTALKPLPGTPNRAEATQHAIRERELFGSSPLARFLDRLVLACDPKELAAIGPFERHIFRVNPTRMQHRIDPKAFQAALADFNKEQSDWTEAANKAAFDDSPTGRMVSDPRAQVRYTGKDMEGVELEVKRGEMVSLFMVNLVARNVEPRGLEIVAQTSLADAGRKFMNNMLNAPPPPASDPLVDLSDDSLAFDTALVSAFRGGQANPLSPSLLKMMLEVDKRDPLSLTPSDALAGYAALDKVNIIAVMPDDLLSMGPFIAGPGKLHVRQFMNSVTSYGTLTLTEKDGWAILTLTDPWESEASFTSRTALATLMNAVHDKGGLDIHDYAKFAFDSRLRTRDGVAMLFLGMYDRSSLSASDQTSWNGLRLYGSFAPVAQHQLEQGGEFKFGGLSGEQRKIVETIAYADRIESEERLDGNTSSLGHLPVEPTDAYPNGLPPDGYVTAKTKSVPILVAYGKGEDGKLRALRTVDVYTLATIEMQMRGNQQMMAQYGVANLVGYAPATNKIVGLRVVMGPGLWKESSITIPDYDANPKPVSWDKLPEPFKKQISDYMDRLRQQKQQGSGTIPPSR